MGDTKLLPCPWCGRSARVKSNTDWHTLIVRHKNSCILRDAQTIFVPRTDEQRAVLIKDWNTRHGPALLARQEGEDAERFAWWFGHRDESSVQLIDMHIESINGKQPSLDDWRAAIDAARSGGGG